MANDALFGQDGTQDPPPPPLAPDPLGGLVTGQWFTVGDSGLEPAPRIAKAPVPQKPGSKAFQQAVDDTMAREARAAQNRAAAQQRRTARPAQPTTNLGRRGTQAVTTARAAAKARDVDTGRKRSGGLGCLLMLLIVLAVIVFFVLRGLAGNLSGLFG